LSNAHLSKLSGSSEYEGIKNNDEQIKNMSVPYTFERENK
jgi:hypothetical protein